MKDIAGVELNIGDTVVVPMNVREIRIGKIVKFSSKKIKVESDIISGFFYPEAILKIDPSIKETIRTLIRTNGQEELIYDTVDGVYNDILTKLNITEKDISSGEYFEKRDDYIYFEYQYINYEIERNQ